MSNGKNGTRVLREVQLEPQDRLGIEVVGRFVEKEQIWFLKQQLAQSNSSALSTGKVSYRGVTGRASKGVHGLFQLAVEIPSVKVIDLLLQNTHFG